MAADVKLEPLDAEGKAASGKRACVMLHKTGSTEDTHWFRFRIGYDSEIFVVEWPNDTMVVELDSDIVGALLHNNWARRLSADEIANYNASLQPKETTS